jgi:hypothetical protein
VTTELLSARQFAHSFNKTFLAFTFTQLFAPYSLKDLLMILDYLKKMLYSGL